PHCPPRHVRFPLPPDTPGLRESTATLMPQRQQQSRRQTCPEPDHNACPKASVYIRPVRGTILNAPPGVLQPREIANGFAVDDLGFFGEAPYGERCRLGL